MKDIIEFLKQLSANNDRVWFNAHKADYQQSKAKFDALVSDLIVGVNEFDPSIGLLSVSDCTWRIYRDTRFSKDKRPYKNYFGCYFAPEGKRGPYSGYYFQIEVSDEDGKVKGMLATGNYETEKRVLQILREDIEYDRAEALEAALEAAKGFSLDTHLMLKRVPKGFDADKPYSDYFKYKNLCLTKFVDEAYVTSDALKERLLSDFASTKQFLGLLNRAVKYAIENGEER